MAAGRSLDQLGCNSGSSTTLANTAFDDIAHAQFLPDLSDVHRPTLEHEAGVARDDKEAAVAAKLGDYVFGNAIGEVFLLGVARHVHERQHGDRRFPGQWQILGWRRG